MGELKPHIWKTKEGHTVFITDMTEQHLSNTIAMLEREYQTLKDQTFCYLYSPTPRGEMAREAFDQEFDYLLDSRLMYVTWLSILRQEQQRRKDGYIGYHDRICPTIKDPNATCNCAMAVIK